MYDAILVPTDGSEGTAETMRHAIHMARDNEATVHALSVVDDRKYQTLPEERRHEARETMEKQAEQAIEEIRERADEFGLDVQTATRVGSPAERILQYASQTDVDVIVIGTHGRSDHERYVRLGSVTQRVVENANVPVFVVHIGGTAP
jgi:nucleotide-binding universal stress UspA family protein